MANTENKKHDEKKDPATNTEADNQGAKPPIDELAKEGTEKNKPLSQETLEGPKKTGQKPGAKVPKNAIRVNIKRIGKSFVHRNIPAATAEAWIKTNPGKWEIVD